ncbi:MAG: hypothetical protein HYU87_09445 [Chloroflexi bacterium]|nr:hypothetical protein [Chloroflexota bacterium]
MSEVYVRVPKRAVPIGAAVITVALLAGIPASRDFVVERVSAAVDPFPVADAGTLASQRVAAEQAIGRAYAKGADQLRQVRELRLPISDEEANKIQAKAIEDLKAVRRGALLAVAEAYAMRPEEAGAYAPRVEQELDAAAVPADGVLLAPRLYTIVLRASDLSKQVADGATVAMTAPKATPSPSPTPAASPSPTRTPAASPTPTPSPAR